MTPFWRQDFPQIHKPGLAFEWPRAAQHKKGPDNPITRSSLILPNSKAHPAQCAAGETEAKERRCLFGDTVYNPGVPEALPFLHSFAKNSTLLSRGQ